MPIAFQPVTRQNFEAVTRLKVAPEQAGFVASNLYSIAEAYVEPAWTPLAIEADGAVVGFAEFGLDEDTGRWWIMRFLIGAEFQGRGLGTAALRALIQLMRDRHGCASIYLDYSPGNDVAERLYARAGFRPTGEIEDGEIVARLDLPPPGPVVDYRQRPPLQASPVQQFEVLLHSALRGPQLPLYLQ